MYVSFELNLEKFTHDIEDLKINVNVNFKSCFPWKETHHFAVLLQL